MIYLLHCYSWSVILPSQTQSEEDDGERKEELRNSISNEPIYEWEGSQRESLGPIVYVTKVKIQHVPCQVKRKHLFSLFVIDVCFFFKTAGDA